MAGDHAHARRHQAGTRYRSRLAIATEVEVLRNATRAHQVGAAEAGHAGRADELLARQILQHRVDEHRLVFRHVERLADDVLVFEQRRHVLVGHIVGKNIYGGTYSLFHEYFERWGVIVEEVDTTDYKALDAAVSGESAKGNAHGCPAKAVYFEVLTNPLLQVNNVTAIAGIVHRHGAIAIVDNTFVTPYLQQPLDQGADIVIHSATKYLAGHSEVNAGLVVVKDDELGKRVYFAQNRLGGVLAPNECDSVRRGIQTLALRMDRQQENARAISSYLLLHPLVKSVHYPGLPGHEYELASNGLKGGGAVLSFEVVPGVDPADVLDNLHIFRLAVSLGAVESLAELPCRMTHFELPREERLKVGITDELVRLAVGVEDKQDLIEDLGQAFDIAYEHYLNRHAGESLFTFAQHVYA